MHTRFLLQAALVKGQGGIATALLHYARMCAQLGIPSASIFRGPSAPALRAAGVELIEPPRMLTWPLAAGAEFLGHRLRTEVLRRAGGREVVVIVHSDRVLTALAAMLPFATFVTPCHSDKFRRKAGADLVLTLNAAQHDAARAALPHTPVALLGNPYVAPPAPAPADARAPRLNFIGRFVTVKAPAQLLEALRHLRGAAPAVRFIGAGPLDPALRAAAAASKAQVSFSGWTAKPFSDFHRNDIVVSPSHWEGLPYLLQEALDHGAPVIASDISGNRQALGDGAYGALYATGDVGALAAAIDAALSDLDALRAKAEKGRAALHARYGAEAFWRALSRELEGVQVRHA